MKRTLYIAVILMMCFSAHAQDPPIVGLFERYIAELNALTRTKDLSKIEQYFHEDFRTNNTNVNIKGVAKRSSRDLDAFLSGLEALTTDNAISLTLKIEEISKVVEEPTYATISAYLTLDLKANGQNMEKSHYSVNMAAIEHGGKWQFIQSDVIRRVKEVNIGECYCIVYTNKDRYVSEFFYPAGLDYTRVFDVFNIDTKDGKRTVAVNSNEWMFDWATDGTLTTKARDNMSLGTASSPQEAITKILELQYQDVCTKFYTQ